MKINQAFYSVPELAELAGVHRNRMRRMLIAAGIQINRCHRTTVVLIQDLKDLAPALWEALCLKASIGYRLVQSGNAFELEELKERVEVLERLNGVS
jgi:hypothetical protein